jgi:large subunit ribosomal protein L25
MAEMTISVSSRTEFGSAASKRLRRRGLVPAIVYGGAADTIPVAVDPKALFKLLRSEAGRNTILTLEIEGSAGDNVIMKDWQVDPVKETFLHVDFHRIAMDKLIRVTIPVAIRGEAIGVKTDGGMLDVVLREIEVECLPADIPERIECEVSELHLHESVRIRDLPLLERVEMLADSDRVVAHVVTIKAEEEAVPEEDEELAEVAPGEEGEPEVTVKGKQEDEAGE